MSEEYDLKAITLNAFRRLYPELWRKRFMQGGRENGVIFAMWLERRWQSVEGERWNDMQNWSEKISKKHIASDHWLNAWKKLTYKPSRHRWGSDRER